MASIVDDLLTQALDDSVPIDSLLRRAEAVANLLDLDELARWAHLELHGYETTDAVPPYRIITGEAQGWSPLGYWVPIIWQSQDERKNFSTWPIRDSIGEIWDRVQRGGQPHWMLPLGSIPLTGPLGKQLTNVSLQLDRAVFVNVVSVVRSKISAWTVKLKKAGIRGEGFSFSEPEKRKAHEPSISINIAHIGSFTGNVGEIQGPTTVSSQAAESPLDLAQVKSFLAQLCDVGGLPDSQGAEIQRSAAALAAELKNQRPDPSRIREALRAIRTVAEGAAGNVIAVGIVQLINRLLGA
jgi:hypothetical protein